MTARRDIRVCGRLMYCGAMRAAGHPGPLCPYCDHIARLLDAWMPGVLPALDRGRSTWWKQ